MQPRTRHLDEVGQRTTACSCSCPVRHCGRTLSIVCLTPLSVRPLFGFPPRSRACGFLCPAGSVATSSPPMSVGVRSILPSSRHRREARSSLTSGASGSAGFLPGPHVTHWSTPPVLRTPYTGWRTRPFPSSRALTDNLLNALLGLQTPSFSKTLQI